jgi:hypothetical protein
MAFFLTTATLPGQEHEHSTTEKLGSVNFATSCSQGAQNEIDRAVALLHSFQFSRAIEGFRKAIEADNTCGIAYWGIALSQWTNPFAPGIKDAGQLQAGRESAHHGQSTSAGTDRERAYIAAVACLYDNFQTTPQRQRMLAYRDAMEALAARYPQDPEAQIFYALSLAAAEDPSDKTYASRLKAGLILEKLFAQQPDHPGLAHYIIHTYDVPSLAPRALAAARRYAAIAPDAPHALHMPSHTFTRTGYWQDSIDSNLAAAAAAKRQGQTAEELHASDYLMYAYLQTAQDVAAQRLLAALPEIDGRFDPAGVIGGPGGPGAGYFALAAIPARFALERHDWKQAIQLRPRQTQFLHTDAITWFVRGLGAARLGQVPLAQESAASLGKIHDRLAKAGEEYWAKQVEIQQLEVSAWTALASGRKVDALRQMKMAAQLEDSTEKSVVTPGPLAPARELLGEMYLALKEPRLAKQEFMAALNTEPGRFHAIYGAAQAAELNGDQESSLKYYRDLLNQCIRADNSLRPELAQARRAISP